MNPWTAYNLTRVAQVAAFFCALFGLSRLILGHLLFGGIVIAFSVMVGWVASVLGAYFKERQNDDTRSQKVALDTLAKLGESRKSAKKTDHKN